MTDFRPSVTEEIIQKSEAALEVSPLKKAKNFWRLLGPGFITGAADDDPSGIATYSQTGAQFGYSQLWTSLFALPFMTVIQEICGRVGMVSGRGLASVIRTYYARPILYGMVLLLFVANTINVGADLGAMAASAKLIFGLPFILWLVVITVVSLTLQILVPYPAYARFLKYLTLTLFAYIAVTFIIHQDWRLILHQTVVPTVTLNRAYLLNIVAILGTTISPYLFFWEADQEAEEDVAHHRLRSYGKGVPRVTKYDIRQMRLDTFIGMFFSQLVMFFIIVTAASTLNAHGITRVDTASQAAEALRPLAGNLTYVLFAAGIIGTGLLAVPILAGSAAYALAESLGWRAGLRYKFRQARPFYVIIAISTGIGLFINYTGIQPFQLLYYTAVINGIVAPPLMIMLLLVSSNKKVMGEHTNSKLTNLAGWLITGVMAVAAIALLVLL